MSPPFFSCNRLFPNGPHEDCFLTWLKWIPNLCPIALVVPQEVALSFVDRPGCPWSPIDDKAFILRGVIKKVSPLHPSPTIQVPIKSVCLAIEKGGFLLLLFSSGHGMNSFYSGSPIVGVYCEAFNCKRHEETIVNHDRWSVSGWATHNKSQVWLPSLESPIHCLGAWFGSSPKKWRHWAKILVVSVIQPLTSVGMRLTLTCASTHGRRFWFSLTQM
jgi:hypothetical protein